MVMKRNALAQNLRQSILRSFGRYIAIAAIIALGAGLFAGLLMTKTDMIATGQRYTDEQNLFDIRVLGSFGWSDVSVDAFQALDAVAEAEGAISLDLIAKVGDKGEEGVYRFYSLPEQINKVALRMGRMPQAADECLADGFLGNRALLGKTVYLADSNAPDSLENMNYRAYRIVGLVSSPLYMDMNRGTTTVGSGSLTNYYYLPRAAFSIDYYTEINLTIPGNYSVYTKEYNNALEEAADLIEPEAERISRERFQSVVADAKQAYEEGYQAYLDGMQEYIDGKRKAVKKLEDAEQELLDAEQTLEENRIKLEDGQSALENGKLQLESARQQLRSARTQYESQRDYANIELQRARAQLDSQKMLLEATYPAALAGLPAAQSAVEEIQAKINGLDPNNPVHQIFLPALNAQLSAAQSTRDNFQQIIDGMAAVQNGYQQLAQQRQQLIDAAKQLTSGESALAANEQKLKASQQELEDGWTEWNSGAQEIADGWAEYEAAKAEAQQKISDAVLELENAQQEISEAYAAILELDTKEPELFLLDRNTNIGYVNLNSNSDIVAGVSRVFPAFFLLVAALVCITTMTRMIEEERTQIGTLKALGYSNAAIIGKYIVYSASGGLLGCSLGLWVGCTIFPQIIWEAYCILLYVQPTIVRKADWTLCAAVVLAYTTLMVLVTWYCCHKTLKEEPASLIRPKSPEAGKKILLEYLPIWKHISFLNKVTIRNIFRYHQRLAMMLVGIGGCTALLLTGFGLRDSIVNIMDFQFESVTHYDLSVYFRDENTPEELARFQQTIAGNCQDFLVYHQSNVDVSCNDQTKSIYMICADDALPSFMRLHSGSEILSMPGLGEAVLSIGCAESMGVQVGDEIQLRGSDLRTLNVIVSGIFDNHVYNYVIVSPETVAEQWGEPPERQMAFLKTGEGQDAYGLSAKLSGLENVMNVSVSEDMANMVRGMMDALDLVVWVIIFCAGLLAVTVLYNLTNININERLREISTIKVLGFNGVETAAYVFKENFVLTVAGALFGLGLGKLLLKFVMSQIKIDLVWFKAIAVPSSYWLSIGLTLLAAFVVSFIFFFKLEKINMAEALKSVE